MEARMVPQVIDVRSRSPMEPTGRFAGSAHQARSSSASSGRFAGSPQQTRSSTESFHNGPMFGSPTHQQQPVVWRVSRPSIESVDSSLLSEYQYAGHKSSRDPSEIGTASSPMAPPKHSYGQNSYGQNLSSPPKNSFGQVHEIDLSSVLEAQRNGDAFGMGAASTASTTDATSPQQAHIAKLQAEIGALEADLAVPGNTRAQQSSVVHLLRIKRAELQKVERELSEKRTADAVTSSFDRLVEKLKEKKPSSRQVTSRYLASPQSPTSDRGSNSGTPKRTNSHRDINSIGSGRPPPSVPAPTATARGGSNSSTPKRTPHQAHREVNSIGSGKPPPSAQVPACGRSFTSSAATSVGFDELCAALTTHLSYCSRVEAASTQIFTGNSEEAAGFRAKELHFQTLISDMSKQGTKLKSLLEFALASRRQGRRMREQAEIESCLRAENETLARDKALLSRQVAEHRVENERKIAERAEMLEATRLEMNNKAAEFQAERERLERDKANTLQELKNVEEASKRMMAQEEAKIANTIRDLQANNEQRVRSAREDANRRLAESREQMEKQIQKERQVTNEVIHVLRELPPLQTAIELGDLRLLEEELQKWRLESLPDRFGDCKGVVEAVVKLAQERLVTWRGVEVMWKEVMKEIEHLPGSVPALTKQGQRIFRVLKESQLTKIDLRRSDPQAIERICDVLQTWQERTMLHPNEVHRLIVEKVVNWPQLGSFDFADLDICLRLVDREGCDAFLSRARALVQNERTSPQNFKQLLSHIETMLFFLKYATSEDLKLTYTEFRKQSAELEPAVVEYFQWAEREYPPGSELVRNAAGKDLMDGNNVASVLQELRKARMLQMKDPLGPFREFFYQWAFAMQKEFNLLALPHHTQTVGLLIFRRFLETGGALHTLIAQVGTGEGKSMIIAALAIYVVVYLQKKVHVVVDDETLLERDFSSFVDIFNAFELPGKRSPARQLSAVLCVSEERYASRSGETYMTTRVDPDADICYCEAKHVQSFYASIARSDKRDFDSYRERVLILDEVDALVIDEEPNDAFVYPSEELSVLATSMARALAEGSQINKIVDESLHPGASRVGNEMSREWVKGQKLKIDEDFVYLKETGQYCSLHAGRANPKAWSLALECRNFQDGLSRHILFQERRFVASKPRVFRKYHRILGLSGSIGNKPERALLRDMYGAAFFKVPPFLKTCRGSPFHDATPVRLGQLQRCVYVEPSPEAQLTRLTEVVLDARERVPVLVIARDRLHADRLVERLRQSARSRGLGGVCEDMIRSLSRTLYESSREQWKENLNRSTLPFGDKAMESSEKTWRITVTDPRGARGTDYRVDDKAVDAQGGLLLVPTIVPSSRREWTQFLGRTARQDCRGQFCCVLCADDYRASSQKFKENLPNDTGLAVVETILRWGDRESQERIQKFAALYNSGLRMNELCEEVFSRKAETLKNATAMESLVEACQRFRWMSVQEVDRAFQQLPGFNPADVPTQARDMGRPADSGDVQPAGAHLTRFRPVSRTSNASVNGTPKVVMFCLDWSASMSSRDTGTPLSRFETCLSCVQGIMREQVRDCDLVGFVVFGPDVRIVFPPTLKGQGGGSLEARIAGLRPQMAGGTRFFDAVAHCLQLVEQAAPKDARRWLVCLTDGDDLGSQAQNSRGEIVTAMLADGKMRLLNMLVITVGALKALTIQIISSWMDRISKAGGIGRHVPEQDAASIAKAFQVVAECLQVEVGGAIEC